MNKKTLIINYFGLRAGGIEKYLCRLIEYSLNNGHRVIWFTSPGNPENSVQPEITNNPKLEKVFFAGGRRKLFKKPAELKLSANEDIVMMSFIPEDYVWAEQFRAKYKCKTFYHYLILMNFFGWLTFPEDEFKSSFLSKRRAAFSSKIAEKLDDNNNIRGFELKHLEAYKTRYDLKLQVSENNILKSFGVDDAVPHEELLNKAKSRNEIFIIYTCARFQFPHKGYLIGLLDVFRELKTKYPNSELNIIGDGEKDTLLDKYNELPDDVKSSINLLGTIPFTQLVDEYKKSHLVIGLAGAISTAASVALPSLVVRHDTYDCETYGFFYKTKQNFSSEKGEPILPYIEHIINCADDEYASIGENCRAVYLKESKQVEPDYIFNQTNNSVLPSVTKRDMRINKMWATISILKKYFKFL